MYYEILISLYRAFVLAHNVDSLCMANRTHSFFIAYRYLHAAVVMHAWDHYI